MQLISDIYREKKCLIFDVGANNGAKSDQFLHNDNHVICIEPQPKLVQQLKEKYLNNLSVSIVNKGLADKQGKLTMSICSNAPTISTFSEEWKQGRFSNYTWDEQIEIETTTLDQLIADYGVPDYCKIDVEGFEFEVLSGLTKPIPAISFEFTKEFIDNVKKCVSYLNKIGFREFNYSLEESDHFGLSNWVGSERLLASIIGLDAPLAWGDIYARSCSFNNLDSQNHDVMEKLINKNIWSSGKPLRLHLGCGEKYLQNYINIDFPESEHSVQISSPADLCADITTISFPPCSVDEVRLHHVFEHFPRPVACALVATWYSWLKQKGKLHIEVPDFSRTARRMLNPFLPFGKRALAERHLFGSHEAAWAVHSEGYTPTMLKQFVGVFGFKNVVIRKNAWRGTYNFELIAERGNEYITKSDFETRATNYLKAFLVDDSKSEKRLLEIWLEMFREHAEKCWAQ